MSNENRDVLAAVRSITSAKFTILQTHNAIERLTMPGVSHELRADCLRALRGSTAYLDVLTSQVYASESHRVSQAHVEFGAPHTEEMERSVFGDEPIRSHRQGRMRTNSVISMFAEPDADDSIFGVTSEGSADDGVYEPADCEAEVSQT